MKKLNERADTTHGAINETALHDAAEKQISITAEEESRIRASKFEKLRLRKASTPPAPSPAPPPAPPAPPLNWSAIEEPAAAATPLQAPVNVKQAHRVTPATIIAQPPPVETLRYCAQFFPEWFEEMQRALSARENISFQSVPLFVRAVLVTFMREPDPNIKYERSCFNLDRNPYPHEHKLRCIAHQISEDILGPGNAYCCRELLFSEQSLAIHESIKRGQDPTAVLPPIHELCVLCHFWLTTRACLDQRNKFVAARNRDSTNVDAPPPEKKLVSNFNRFMVMMGVPGEYDPRAMLASDDLAFGVWGPFPLFNRNNYIPARLVSEGGVTLRGFIEHDRLLFQQARTLSTPTEPSNSNSSTPQNPTNASRINSRSRK